MGRPTWATPEQAAFLKGFVGRLEEEKHNQGLKPFYATVTAEFINRWASPIPPDVDTTKVTDPARLKELSDKYQQRVSRIPPPSSSPRSVLTPITLANPQLVQELPS